MYPFWAMLLAPSGQEDVVLELHTGTFDIPFCAITTKDTTIRLKKTAGAVVTVTIPYLTNTLDVKQGSSLRWRRELPLVGDEA